MIPLIKTDGQREKELIASLKRRSGEVGREVETAVREILDRVKEGGDAAVLDYSMRFDHIDTPPAVLDRSDLKKAAEECDSAFLTALQNAAANIESFHKRQVQKGWSVTDDNGCMLGQKIRGLHRVGIYVPGGTAAYPSTVLMNTIPARIAGVGEIIMVTPPPKTGLSNREILAAAYIAGVDKVYQVGGAQAVAALAYGTESFPKVDKIVGPGNLYVATAKRLLYGVVDIDMVAGPSEILIIADESANPKYLAADLMSQAEHDALASSILLTTSLEVAEQTRKELSLQMQSLSRRDMIEKSLDSFGAVIVCKDMEEAVDFANLLAPEHLEVMTKDPESLLPRLDNAGSIFLGAYSPEPLGDYYAGPNHVLPTSGTARFFSPLSVDSFLKKSSFIRYTRQALTQASKDIVLLAETEGLTAHANSIRVRSSGNEL